MLGYIMPIKISRILRAGLPQEQKAGIKEYLIANSNGVCALCELSMRNESETLVADHIIPERENGATDQTNLQLVHAWCNSNKLNYPDEQVKPYIKFARRYHQTGQGLNFGQAIEQIDLFDDIEPSPCSINEEDGIVRFRFSDNTETQTNLFVDNVLGREYKFCFVKIPITAIFNDDECQPRTIKSPHIKKIYFDLLENPLNEPPNCRIIDAPEGLKKIVMFDGQHKTLASLLRGKENIVVKVYLDMTRDEATRLINTIQNKIVKLKASSFEAMGKLAQEFAADYERYSEQAGEEASEHGFIEFVDGQRRTRARDAFTSALVEELYDLQSDILSWIRYQGRPVPDSDNYPTTMTETMFKNHIAKVLIHTKPLEDRGEVGNEKRTLERTNITKLLHIWISRVTSVNGDNDTFSDEDKIRIDRTIKQTSLKYSMGILKKIFGNITAQEPETALLLANPNEESWARIETAIHNLVDHPVWSTSTDVSTIAADVANKCQKGESLTNIMNSVQCNLNYCIVGDLPTNPMNVRLG